MNWKKIKRKFKKLKFLRKLFFRIAIVSAILWIFSLISIALYPDIMGRVSNISIIFIMTTIVSLFLGIHFGEKYTEKKQRIYSQRSDLYLERILSLVMSNNIKEAKKLFYFVQLSNKVNFNIKRKYFLFGLITGECKSNTKSDTAMRKEAINDLNDIKKLIYKD